MRHLRPVIALVLASLSFAAAANSLRVIEGQADLPGYQQALLKQGEWFQRAANVCTEREYCEKPVIMHMKVGTDGRASECRLIDSDIKDAQTAGLFCSIVKHTVFPAAAAPVVAEFTLAVGVFGDNGRERCPAELGSRRDNPGLVRKCLDTLLGVINGTRSAEAHQYGVPLADMDGRMQLKISIAPSGKVRDVDVVASDIKSRAFRRTIVQIIELIDFGPAAKREEHAVSFRVPFEGIEGS